MTIFQTLNYPSRTITNEQLKAIHWKVLETSLTERCRFSFQQRSVIVRCVFFLPFFFFFFLIIPERQTILWTAEPTNGNESISARKASRYRLVEKPPGSLIPRPDHLRVSWQYFIKPEPLAAH